VEARSRVARMTAVGYEYEPPVAGMMKSVYLRSMMGLQPARDPLPKVI
jgi:hypothetical protein